MDKTKLKLVLAHVNSLVWMSRTIHANLDDLVKEFEFVLVGTSFDDKTPTLKTLFCSALYTEKDDPQAYHIMKKKLEEGEKKGETK